MAGTARCRQRVSRYRADMGFNPNRKYQARPADYALVAVALLLAAGLVVWAVFA